MHIKCPKCKIRIDGVKAGSRITCTNCQEPLRVPSSRKKTKTFEQRLKKIYDSLEKSQHYDRIMIGLTCVAAFILVFLLLDKFVKK
ncbi:hypothetical protein KIH39_13945 [Telmatocola sphagniphila]|jgi:hypothetical protein|uniref:Uncharacterized protein n=1 Tax=Telmatocola sphagniphila TaxID=1123043 RepID=A0A8E6B134_9BACT|nr:hypothetical protein [Telmatocola sphagniphila]QVL29970.1 hypothetical protein KIH39_13945 [Telmatocola sphagniphila]